MTIQIRKSFLLLAAATLLVPFVVYAQTAKTGVVSQYRAITVVSQPRAGVWIDGVRYGTTDANGNLAIGAISAGAHILRLRADGFAEKSQPLAATQRGEVRVTLSTTTDQAELAFQEAERLLASDRDQAVAAYRKAIKIKPNYPDAYLSLGRVLSDAGELDEAMDAILAARRLRPGFAEASAVEGRIHKENGDDAKAIAAFKRSITEGKGFQPEAYAGLGLYYKEKAEGYGGAGDFANENLTYSEAGKYLKSAIKQLAGAPDNIVIYQLLGLIYERQKRFAEAIALYEEFLRIFPDSVEATAVRSFIVQIKKDMVSQ